MKRYLYNGRKEKKTAWQCFGPLIPQQFVIAYNFLKQYLYFYPVLVTFNNVERLRNRSSFTYIKAAIKKKKTLLHQRFFLSLTPETPSMKAK